MDALTLDPILLIRVCSSVERLKISRQVRPETCLRKLVSFVRSFSHPPCSPSGWWAQITTVIYDKQDSYSPTVCTSTISAKNRTTVAATSAVLVMVALCMGAAGYMHRKRRVAKINLATEEERAVTGEFEMMSDRAVAV